MSALITGINSSLTSGPSLWSLSLQYHSIHSQLKFSLNIISTRLLFKIPSHQHTTVHQHQQLHLLLYSTVPRDLPRLSGWSPFSLSFESPHVEIQYTTTVSSSNDVQIYITKPSLLLPTPLSPLQISFTKTQLNQSD